MEQSTKGKKLVGLLGIFVGSLMALITFGENPISFCIWCICVAGSIFLLKG